MDQQWWDELTSMTDEQLDQELVDCQGALCGFAQGNPEAFDNYARRLVAARVVYEIRERQGRLFAA